MTRNSVCLFHLTLTDESSASKFLMIILLFLFIGRTVIVIAHRLSTIQNAGSYSFVTNIVTKLMYKLTHFLSCVFPHCDLIRNIDNF